jgi:hypothetical protein
MGENVRTTTLSLWSGGLLYRLGRRTRLLNDDPLDVLRRSVALLLVAWAPLMLLALLHGIVTRTWHPILYSLTNHIRWWFAVPLLFAAERLVDQRLDQMSHYLRESGIVSGANERRLGQLEQLTTACCNSPLLEIVLLAIAVATCAGQMRVATDAPSIWLAAVMIPLSRFLVFRWLQRWIFWTFLLAQIARLDLKLNGLHPDRAGGLSVLVLPSRALGLVFIALGSVVASDLFERMPPGDTLDRHWQQIATYAGLCLAIAATPLMSFLPVMVRAKRHALWSYGVFGQEYVQDFKDRWLPSAKESPLGSSDIQSLADLGNGYDVLRGMRLVPFPRDFLLQIAIAAMLPLLPVYLHTVSITTIAAQLVDVIL